MSLKVRRHYKLLLLLALVSAVSILGAGDHPIVAYTVRGSEQAAAQVASDGSEVVLSASSIVHGIQNMISGVGYHRLSTIYQGTGDADGQPGTPLPGGGGDASR